VGCQSAALTAAKLYLQQNEPQKAKEQLQQALEVEPAHAEAHFLLGKIYAEEGNYEEMAGAFARSLSASQRFLPQIQEQRQHYWAMEYNEGVRLASAQPPDFSTALRSFRRATLADRNRLEGWRNLAYVYYQLDSLDAAIGAYQSLLSIAPGDTTTLYSLGVLHLKQGRPQEAMQVLSRFLESKPGHVDGLLNLAVAHLALGDSVAAEATYRRAIEAAPGDARPHYNLGNLYFNQKQYQAALKAYQQAVERAPGDLDARYNLAVTLLALDEMDRAFPLLQELAVQQPDNPGVWRELGRIHALKGRVAESEQAYARADSLAR